MSHHPTNVEGVTELVRKAIEGSIEGARAEVTGGGGHYSIVVVSPAFADKGMLESHRMVLGAIAHLMAGDSAPVHAVDSLRTKVA